MNSAPATRRRRAYRDTSDVMDAVGRLVMAMGRRVAHGTIDELAELLELQNTLDAAVQTAVDGLRASGHTWDELGAVTGHTRQAALKRWNRPRSPAA